MPMLEHQPSKVQTKTQRLREKLYMLQGSKCFYCSRSIPEGVLRAGTCGAEYDKDE